MRLSIGIPMGKANSRCTNCNPLTEVNGNKTEINSNGKIRGLNLKIKNYELGKNLGTSGVLDQK